MLGVFRVRTLRQLARRQEDFRPGLGDLEGKVVLVGDPTLELDLVLHPAVELQGMRADDLRVDAPDLEVLREGIRDRLEVLVGVAGAVRVFAVGYGAGQGLGGAQARNVPDVVPELVGEARPTESGRSWGCHGCDCGRPALSFPLNIGGSPLYRDDPCLPAVDAPCSTGSAGGGDPGIDARR